MFPSSIIFWIILIMVALLGAAAAGVIIGLLVSLGFKTGLRGIGVDALLGAAGFLGGVILSSSIPWSECYVDNDWLICGQFPHYGRIVGMTILLPMIHQWIRYRRYSKTVRHERSTLPL